MTETVYRTQAQELVQLAESVSPFRTPDGEVYGSFVVGPHVETWLLRSRGFKNYLASLYCSKRGRPPCAQALQDTLNVLHGRAQLSPQVYPVFTRLAQNGDTIYLHLGDEQWQVVEITSSGWRILTRAPVCFLKPKGMLPLPIPVSGGDVNDLLPLFNLSSYEDFILVVSWLLAACKPEGPYPILIYEGEQGSTKTVAERMMKDLIDPSVTPLRTLFKSERDLMIAAKNSRVLAFDNLSKIPDWMSDALCRLSTGGGLSTRELYSDVDEVLFDATRPVILNGIGGLATRGDLLDRSIIITLPRISQQDRKLEEELWREFEALRPKILGALLDGLVHALYYADKFELHSYPRMADFAHWSVAASTGLPWEGSQFIEAYERNQRRAHQMCLEADSVAEALQRFMQTRSSWEGTATDLLKELRWIEGDAVFPSSLPKKSNWLVHSLKRLGPSLRRHGLETTFNERVRPRTILLQRITGG